LAAKALPRWALVVSGAALARLAGIQLLVQLEHAAVNQVGTVVLTLTVDASEDDGNRATCFEDWPDPRDYLVKREASIAKS
jgi:hypothetical protein